MKPPTLAPFYGCLYPGLCEIAQKHGYTLAIHGSMVKDLDFVAVPWTDEATDAETMVEAIRLHCSAVLYPELLTRHGMLPERAEGIAAREGRDPCPKPHGRLAWSLHLDFGAYIDLSVMPRLPGPAK